MASASNNSLPVLVIGAGPAGLAAALSLVQNGIPVRLIDKTASFHASSRGSGLHPRTLETFRFLGVLDNAKRLGRPVSTLRSYKLPGGTEVTRTWEVFGKLEPSPDRPEGRLTLSQYLTEGIFRDHLGRNGIQTELNTEPLTILQDDKGVTVTLKSVDANGMEKVEEMRAAYVVGADGAKGATRKLIGATFGGLTKDADGQVWADAEIEGVSSDYWHMWSESGKATISMRPKDYDGGLFHVGIIGQSFDTVDLVDQQKFVDFFYKMTGRKDVIFKGFTSITYWKPKMRMVDKFSEGRVFIVGDAAHVHSPSGAQGLNTSVADSFNLAWKIALAYKGLASPDLLASYHIERLPVVAQVLAATSSLYTHLVTRATDSTVNSTNANASGFFQWRHQGLDQLGVNYRWSPAVYDARGMDGLTEDEMKARAYEGYPAGGDVRAGDRAPDAPALVDASGQRTALFDVFRPNIHTVLVFSPDGGRESGGVEVVLGTAQDYPAGIVQTVVLRRRGVSKVVDGATAYHDSEGHAYRAYRADENVLTIVVVRPDGYVGALVYGFDGLQQYFSRIFATPGLKSCR